MSSSTLERDTRTAARSGSGRGTRAGSPTSAGGTATSPRPTRDTTTRGTTTGTTTRSTSTRATTSRGSTTGTTAAASTRAGARAASARARTRTGTKDAAPETTGGTAPFVLLIMVLLTSGLVATLWLSTAAAADSYRLDAARQATRDRTEEVERLHRDVAAMQSAPALAAAAQRIGMVPAGVPAVILVHPDGTSQVVGTPSKARAAAPPPAPQPATGPAAPGGPAPAAPADPEALANDPRSGVQASTGGAPAPAPAGAGTPATPPAPAGAGATTTIPAAPVNPVPAGGR